MDISCAMVTKTQPPATRNEAAASRSDTLRMTCGAGIDRSACSSKRRSTPRSAAPTKSATHATAATPWTQTTPCMPDNNGSIGPSPAESCVNHPSPPNPALHAAACRCRGRKIIEINTIFATRAPGNRILSTNTASNPPSGSAIRAAPAAHNAVFASRPCAREPAASTAAAATVSGRISTR